MFRHGGVIADLTLPFAVVTPSKPPLVDELPDRIPGVRVPSDDKEHALPSSAGAAAGSSGVAGLLFLVGLSSHVLAACFSTHTMM